MTIKRDQESGGRENLVENGQLAHICKKAWKKILKYKTKQKSQV